MIGHPLDRYRIKSKLGEGDFEPFEVTRLAGLGSGGANQFEGMRPALLPKAWNAPELAERLDGTRRRAVPMSAALRRSSKGRRDDGAVLVALRRQDRVVESACPNEVRPWLN